MKLRSIPGFGLFAAGAFLLTISNIARAQIAAPIESAANLAPPSAGPVDHEATPEARALLREIDELSGHYTLIGQHNFPNHVSRWSDRIYDLTGKYPALFGSDFGFSGDDDKDSAEGRPAMIEEVKRQYRSGSVIALCWHAVKPTEDEPVTFRDSVQGHLTDFEWDQLLTPGTALNQRWAAQVDVIAGYLKQLQAAGVPVLFRPYHEMNGNFFWWGGRPGAHGSAELYRMIYDRLVNLHHIHNLVWVWNVNNPGDNVAELPNYDPGHAYADVYTIDVYGEFKQSYYDTMLAMAGDKPIAFAEVGNMPSLEVLARQPRWAYFMMWSGSNDGNPPELMQANFHAPNLLTRSDPALAKYAPAPAGPQRAEPVSRDATKQAAALLARLYAGSAALGNKVLSGQQLTEPASALPATPAPTAGSPSTSAPAATAPTASTTEQVFAATGAYPAIYQFEIGADVSPAGLKSIIAEAKREHTAGAIISLRWTPLAPANGGPENPSAVQAALTGFEWNELLTPGTDLNKRWAAQVDTLAAALKQLQQADIAVLWDPYPESNGKQHWWAGHPGIHGSAELYRMLFSRLTDHDRVGNLVWVWTAAPTGYGPAANGSYFDYFPGLLYTDALAVDLRQPQAGRARADAFLSTFGAGKVVGVEFAGGVPDPALFAQSKWAWFLLAPQAAITPEATQALKILYADPHIESRPAVK